MTGVPVLEEEFAIKYRELDELREHLRMLEDLCAKAYRCRDAREVLGGSLTEAKGQIYATMLVLDRIEFVRKSREARVA